MPLVTLHPYFRVKDGKSPEEFEAIVQRFSDATANQKTCIFYGFTHDAERKNYFCREGYTSGEAVISHLEDVGAILEASSEVAELTKLEIHGPAAELAKIKEKHPEFDELAQYFVQMDGIGFENC